MLLLRDEYFDFNKQKHQTSGIIMIKHVTWSIIEQKITISCISFQFVFQFLMSERAGHLTKNSKLDLVA